MTLRLAEEKQQPRESDGVSHLYENIHRIVVISFSPPPSLVIFCAQLSTPLAGISGPLVDGGSLEEHTPLLINCLNSDGNRKRHQKRWMGLLVGVRNRYRKSVIQSVGPCSTRTQLSSAPFPGRWPAKERESHFYLFPSDQSLIYFFSVQ